MRLWISRERGRSFLRLQADVAVDHAAVDQEGKRLPQVRRWVHDCANVLIGGGLRVGRPMFYKSFKFGCCSDCLVCGAGEQVPLVLDGMCGAEWAEAFMSGQA